MAPEQSGASRPTPAPISSASVSRSTRGCTASGRSAASRCWRWRRARCRDRSTRHLRRAPCLNTCAGSPCAASARRASSATRRWRSCSGIWPATPTAAAAGAGLAATALVAVGGTVGAVRARAAWGASICREGAARATAVWPAAPARQGAAGGRPRRCATRSRAPAGPMRRDLRARRSDPVALRSRWIAAYGDACEATHVRHEQPAAVLDLRTACLGERLAGARALTDALMLADAAVVDHAANAALRLPICRCSDRCCCARRCRRPGSRAAGGGRAAARSPRRGPLLASTGHFDASATDPLARERACAPPTTRRC